MQIHPVQNEADWEAVKTIRTRVFIEEQQCTPEDEWDEHDAVPMATARWRTVPFEERLVAKLERFAVLPAYRGQGYGRALVRYVMHDASQAGFETFVIHAQSYLEAFYTDLGFVSIGSHFEEAGIPHVKMVCRPGGGL